MSVSFRNNYQLEQQQDETQPVRITQPRRASLSAPVSGYIIFGGQVQIFDDDWKEREPMSGEFDYMFWDVCWDRGDCLLSFLLPCIYQCLLVTGISKFKFIF